MCLKCMLSDINPTLASTDTDAHPEFHIPKVDSIETDDEMAVKVKVGSLISIYTVSTDTNAHPEFHIPKVDSIEA